MVTADHAHTSQITSGGTETFGRTTKLRTADGSDMVINYANAGSNDDDVALGGQGHTGAQVKPDTTGKGQDTDAGDKKYAASRPGMARTGSTAVPLAAAAAVLVTLGAGAGLYTRRRSH